MVRCLQLPGTSTGATRKAALRSLRSVGILVPATARTLPELICSVQQGFLHLKETVPRSSPAKSHEDGLSQQIRRGLIQIRLPTNAPFSKDSSDLDTETNPRRYIRPASTACTFRWHHCNLFSASVCFVGIETQHRLYPGGRSWLERHDAFWHDPFL